MEKKGRSFFLREETSKGFKVKGTRFIIGYTVWNSRE